jgi:hypothetical protein
VLLGVAGISMVVFVVGGLLWAVQSAPRTISAAAAPHQSEESSSRPADPLPIEEPLPNLNGPGQEVREAFPRVTRSLQTNPPQERSQSAPGANRPGQASAPAGESFEDRLQRSIERGLAYLKRCRGQGRSDGLHGLTLLECGVAASDAQVQQLADSLRQQKDQLNNTYDLGLAILFLGRLGAAQDRPLIRTFALRLAAGQNGDGAWTYTCPLLDATRERQIEGELKALRFATADSNISVSFLATPLPPPERPGPPRRPTPGRPRPGQPLFVFHPGGDHSNTQFALLGLWTARRLGVPVDWCLRRAALHFRQVAAPGGFWSYLSNVVSAPAQPYTASGTCAGLLALGMDYGLRIRREQKMWVGPAGPMVDPALHAGLRYLGEVLAGQHPPRARGFPLGPKGLFGVDARSDLYFLWSLERVAVLYGITHFGGTSWFKWAAPRVIDAQHPDGSWNEAFGGIVDTCFALLSLKRSNVVRDLTDTLHGVVQTGPPRPPTPAATTARPPAPRPSPQGTTIQTLEQRR